VKGIIFDIKRFAIHDGPGIRSTVFFKGCPLSCAWCHNPESQEKQPLTTKKISSLDGIEYESPEIVGYETSVEEVMEEVLQDNIFYEESGGGITFSGGEPLMQPEFLLSLLKECANHGIHTSLDTCGYADPEVFEMVIPLTDLFLYDLKLQEEENHIKYTSRSNMLIIKNLELLVEKGARVVIRFPLIPGITNSESNMANIGEIMSRLSLNKIDILPYHIAARKKYQRLNKDYSLTEVEEIEETEVAKVISFFNAMDMETTIGG